jgi:hypothetical protein
VGADGGVPCRARQVFALTERDVFALRVLVALGQTEVNDVDVVLGAFIAANEEVVGFDVPMDDALLVDLLDTVDLNKTASNSQVSI